MRRRSGALNAGADQKKMMIRTSKKRSRSPHVWPQGIIIRLLLLAMVCVVALKAEGKLQTLIEYCDAKQATLVATVNLLA